MSLRRRLGSHSSIKFWGLNYIYEDILLDLLKKVLAFLIAKQIVSTAPSNACQFPAMIEVDKAVNEIRKKIIEE